MAVRYVSGDEWTIDVTHGRGERHQFTFHGDEAGAYVYEKACRKRLGYPVKELECKFHPSSNTISSLNRTPIPMMPER